MKPAKRVLTQIFRLKCVVCVVVHVQGFQSLDDTLYDVGLSATVNTRNSRTTWSAMFLGYVEGRRGYRYALFWGEVSNAASRC